MSNGRVTLDDFNTIPDMTIGEEQVGLVIRTLDDFVNVDEPGSEPLLGKSGEILIPESGDVMFYGDGGAGKTTLMNDLAFHLAAGDDWLGITVPRPVRVLLIENEGPRPLFRAKLRRKRDGWTGSPLGNRLQVIEAPWAVLTLAKNDWRQTLAATIRNLEIDVVIVGPLSRIGMNEAGTLQDVAEFMALIADVRSLAERRCAVILVHHEGKSGRVSGAWEGSGDTLLHVGGEGNGHTRLYVQKARWASEWHGETLHLTWMDGEGFAVEDKPEIDDDTLADRFLKTIAQTPGISWTKVQAANTGVSKESQKRVRDRLFAAGLIVNVVNKDGIDTVLRECPARQKASLYLAEDPTLQRLRPPSGAVPAQAAPAPGADEGLTLRRAPRPIRGAGVGAAAGAPANEPFKQEIERLEAIGQEMGL